MPAQDSQMMQFLGIMVTISLIPMAVVLVYMIRKGLKTGSQLQGGRTVTCPETGDEVTVEVDAKHAGYTAAYDSEEVRLTDCTRWPEKAGCRQDCVGEIKHEAAK